MELELEWRMEIRMRIGVEDRMRIGMRVDESGWKSD